MRIFRETIMYFKDFDSWNEVKKRVNKEKQGVYIRAGELRWSAIGVNVGSEMDGKGRSFTRPVLVINIVGPYLALVIPITTKVKNVPGYISFSWKGENQSICIHQMRVISQKRILDRIGKISEKKLSAMKQNVIKFFSLSKLRQRG